MGWGQGLGGGPWASRGRQQEGCFSSPVQLPESGGTGVVGGGWGSQLGEEDSEDSQRASVLKTGGSLTSGWTLRFHRLGHAFRLWSGN